jgi:UDP-N-acetylenolpyruvoylglucosamine reductase
MADFAGRAALCKTLEEQGIPYEENAPLAPLTTFRIGGKAALVAQPRSAEELACVLTLYRDYADTVPLWVLGNGSNVLVSDDGIEGLVVLTATFKLRKGDPEAIRARMDELAHKRESKQPLDRPSAGSTFKRPEGHFAGKLISDAGLQGFQVGGAAVSKKHAGFVVNLGGATAADVRAVIEHVQDEVERQFGVRLEPEVRFLG